MAKHVELKIEGMSCNHCKMAVEKKLNSVSGVSDVVVDLEKGSASLSADDAIDTNILVTAVKDAGYDAALA